MPILFIMEIEKKNLNNLEAQKTSANIILSNTSNAGNIAVPKFKLYHKGQGGIALRQVDPQIKYPDISPCSYSHLIFDKDTQSIH